MGVVVLLTSTMVNLLLCGPELIAHFAHAQLLVHGPPLPLPKTIMFQTKSNVLHVVNVIAPVVNVLAKKDLPVLRANVVHAQMHNGHGTCQSIAQIADDFSHNADDGAASALFAVPNSDNDCDNCIGTQNTGAQYDNAWDAQRAQGCKCDAGYRGPDCSLKECPSGDDTLEGHGGSKGRACSGRGSCDYDSGQSVCYIGFYGNRCQSMTVLA